MALFNDIDDFQAAVRVNGDLDVDTLLIHVEQARKYVEPWAGVALVNLCFDQDANSTDSVKALLPYMRACVGPFTMVEAAPVLDVGASNSGFIVTMTGTAAPASRDRVAAFSAQMISTGYDALVRMMEFLLANKANYSQWTGAVNAYSRYTGHVLRNSIQMTEFVDVPVSARQFFETHAKFSEVESEYVAGYISSTLLAQIVTEVIAGTVTAVNKVILPWICRGLANKFVAEITDDEKKVQKFINTAEYYLTKAQKYMDANIASYPLYEASDCYSATRTTYEKFENKAENTFFNFNA